MNKRYHITGKTKTLKRYANVHDTIEAIQRIVQENYMVVTELADLLQGRSDEDTFRNIWNYVRRNIRYQNDQKGKEQLRIPQRTLTDRTGDCDDMSILISAILTNFGYRHELIVAAYKAKNKWQHIYPVAYDQDGNRYVLDCVPEIPRFNYEAKPIINQIVIDMKLEELGIYDVESLDAEAINEMTEPFSLDGLGYMDDDDEVLTIQGLLGDVAMVDEDDDHDTVLSGSELKENIMLRQLVDARETLKNEVNNPSELSQLNDNRTELALVNNIISNFGDEDSRDQAISEAINSDTLFKNFYKTIKIGLNDVVNGLSGDDEDDLYYLKVMDQEGMLEDILIDEDDDLDGDLGRRKKGGFRKKLKAKIQNFKKKHPKLAKIGNALKKFSPTMFALRRSMGAFMRVNAFKMAEKLAIGYQTESKAKQMGYSRDEWQKFVDAKNKAENKWYAMGGKKDYFKKIIMKGRGSKKAGLRGELGIAPAIVAAVKKVFGFVFKIIDKLKLRKQNKASSSSASPSPSMPSLPQSSGQKRMSSDGNDFDAEPEFVDPSAPSGTTDEKSGVTEQVVTDESGNETTVYTDPEGNEINKFKALFLKNKKLIIIISSVLVVGVIALIIWKARQKSMSGLGRAGISRKQENFIKRQQLNNRSYASLIREEIKKDGKKLTSPNRRKYYKSVFRESFQRPLSTKQVSAAQRFNDIRRKVREKAKSYGGGKQGWQKAWAEVKKK